MTKYSFLQAAFTVFFGDEGLSMSEANHMANMIKELNKTIDGDLNQATAAKETIDFENKAIDRDSKSIDFLDLCTKEGKYYALSAWLREAIKAKDGALNLARVVTNDKFLNDDEVFDKRPDLEIPIMKHIILPLTLIESDAIGEMTIKERAEYFSLEAKAAWIGKRIHPGGVLHNIREELLNFKNYDVARFKVGNGEKDYPVTRKAKYGIDDINNVFFKLQKEHREVEQKLNWYKAKIKNDMSIANAKEQKEYTSAYNIANNEFQSKLSDYNKIMSAYNNSITALKNKMEERRTHIINAISKWKVLIPKEHEVILKEIKSLID